MHNKVALSLRPPLQVFHISKLLVLHPFLPDLAFALFSSFGANHVFTEPDVTFQSKLCWLRFSPILFLPLYHLRNPFNFVVVQGRTGDPF
mmetsp:Transcript_12236/g.12053  ORF Transcript_12236/g.12053 Transcript_12236/m.12053 type:complete len:90 (-) Transcript_12236:1694-1963(-)